MSMGSFLLVLAVFLVSHLIPAVPGIRRAIVARTGFVPFVAGYSLMSTALFVWLIRTALRSPYIPLWPPTAGAFAFTVVLMPLALMLFGASLLAPNTLSIAFVPGDYRPERPGAVAITRHPILWGLGLWGLAHVPPNGDVVALIMFGGLGLFAFLGMAAVEYKKRSSLGGARWAELAASTSVVPFAAILAGRARLPTDGRTLAGAGAGLLAAGALLAGGHLWLFDRDPLALF